MSKNKPAELFTKRLASLLLTQARSKPYIKSNTSGFKSVGEILASDEYWQKKEKQWKEYQKNGNQ